MTAGGDAVRRRRPFRILVRSVGWDLRLQLRYQIVTIALLVTALYALLFRALPALARDDVLVLLIFSDPTMLGFLFIGVLVLFEKGASTLEALTVTPLSPAQYLGSKSLSLTAIALPCGTVMALAGRGTAIDPLPLLLAIALSSVLFVLLGFAAVARVRTVNEYLLIVPLFLAPLNLPLLSLFGVTDSRLLYLLPTQASLVLFQRAFAPRPVWELAYGVGFLGLSVAVAFVWARRAFEAHVKMPGGAR